MNQTKLETFKYDDDIVKKFLLASLLFGAVAFLVGLLIALQLAYWPMNMNLKWLTFGRIRPLHTNAAIFAFAGNAVFGGIYHSMQRLLKTRLFSDTLSRIHFWGWQLIIVGAAITLPLGLSQAKEYAELEWPIDIAITLIWVVFAVNFFGTIYKRRERHIFVAIWFYIATVITVAVLHIVNSLEVPVSLFESYPLFAGIQDAMVQWWYGHNAVAFFLTTPFLGLMYYYLPKAANRPVYSYRLSIVHFWALVFIYIWAGPHHLLYTSLPEWAQTLGMVFSVMLWAPSWGGMINGLLTLRGAWHLLRTDPVIKFMVAAVTFYGMATFEGPLLSIKSVSSLAHYTDWIIGHVHSGALGWNGFLTFGVMYYLLPRLWNTKLYSIKLANIHFWLGLFGILIYYTSMITAGITEGLMWRAIDSSGKLVYPDFIETIVRVIPLFWARAGGGALFLVGFLVMLINMYKTISLAPKAQAEETFSAPAMDRSSEPHVPFHRRLEGMTAVFSVMALLAILVGTTLELYPTLFLHKYLPDNGNTRPYTSLELAGRDVYTREGCYLCHSQQIRPLAAEVLRYGPPSTAEESMYDHPFQWGSKRNGPDLAREGKRFPNLWHYRHMMDPRSVTAQSIMPVYSWLAEDNLDFMILRKKLTVMKNLGVPYTPEEIGNADIDAEKQAQEIAAGLEAEGAPKGLEKKEIVALIAYLQSLGQKTKGATP
jgi:cytochrome c oxidase cbb3-type subunit I/II